MKECILCFEHINTDLVTLNCGHNLHLDCFWLLIYDKIDKIYQESFLPKNCENTNSIEKINDIYKLECPYCRQDIDYRFNIRITRSKIKMITKLYNDLDYLLFLNRTNNYSVSSPLQLYFLYMYIHKVTNLLESLYCYDTEKIYKSLTYNLYKTLYNKHIFMRNNNLYNDQTIIFNNIFEKIEKKVQVLKNINH